MSSSKNKNSFSTELSGGISENHIFIEKSSERIVKTIEFSSGDTAKDGKIGLKIVFITSIGATGYLPNIKDTKNKKIGRAW